MSRMHRLIRSGLVLTALFGAWSAAAEPPLAARLDAIVKAHHPSATDPGVAVLVSVDGKAVLRQGYGLADVQGKQKIGPDTVFRIASISKQFTAVGVLKLVQAGKVSLDDPVNKHLPEVDLQGKPVTIANLLSHTSGIPNLTALPDYDKQIEQDRTPAQLVAMVAGQPMEFEPGAQFRYSNTNYILLGMLIEKLSGVDYAAYIQREIAGPLGLKDTRYIRDDALTPRHARGYEPDSAGNWAPAPALSMTQPFSAGALESTVDDLATWTAALVGGKVIDPALLERAWTPFATTAQPSRYGFGWYIRAQPGERWIGHGGAINGFTCEAVWIPERKVFVAVLRNSLCDITPQLLVRELAMEAVGRPMPRKQPVTLPPATMGRYAGTYVVSPELKFTVTRSGSKLFVQPNGQPRIELFAEAEDRFFARVAEMAFSFAVEGQKAVRMTVQMGRQEMTAERAK